MSKELTQEETGLTSLKEALTVLKPAQLTAMTPRQQRRFIALNAKDSRANKGKQSKAMVLGNYELVQELYPADLGEFLKS